MTAKSIKAKRTYQVKAEKEDDPFEILDKRIKKLEKNFNNLSQRIARILENQSTNRIEIGE